ncbi:MAG: 50S ribosomal protein L25 [Pirellulaceae bacterium]|nr:50S ribosomal protein L25 [Planctomycetales bacterium]
MIDVLKVESREKTGSANSRRLRRAGKIPAVLYGHGQDNVSLTVSSARVEQVIRHGGHVVHLEGAASGEALIKSVQWDSMGSYLVHIDLFRVVEGETINVVVAVELKGDAPGAGHGGVIEQVLHEIEITCPVTSVPDKLLCNVSALDVGGSIHVGEVPLPAGAKPVTDAEAVLVHCVAPRGSAEADETGGGEPEVIGRKAGEANAD